MHLLEEYTVPWHNVEALIMVCEKDEFNLFALLGVARRSGNAQLGIDILGITASRQMGYIIQSDHGLASSILSVSRFSIQCTRGARSNHVHAMHLLSSIELTVSASVLMNTCVCQ